MYCCLCNAPIEMLLFILNYLLFQDEEPPNYSLTDNSVDAGTVTTFLSFTVTFLFVFYLFSFCFFFFDHLLISY